MRKKSIRLVIIAVVLTCIFMIASRFFNASSKNTLANSENSNTYTAVEVKKGSIAVKATGSGSVTPSERKQIVSNTEGTIQNILVSKGDEVKKDDILVTFEDDSESIDIQNAKLNLSLQNQQLASLQNDKNNLKVYAPYSGTIGDIKAIVGKEVSKGYLFTTISDDTKLEVKALYNKLQVDNIKIGQKATIELPEYFNSISGTVTNIDDSITTNNTGAVFHEVTIEIENLGGLDVDTNAVVYVQTDNGRLIAQEAKIQKITPIDVNLKYGGVIDNILVNSGDVVIEGQLIAELVNSSLDDQINSQLIKIEQTELSLTDKLNKLDDTTITSTLSGTVLNVNVDEGEKINSKASIVEIADLSTMKVTIPVDELDINKVELGQKAIITAEAVQNTVFEAEVTDIDIEGKSTNGVSTFDVTLTLIEHDGLKPGMSVNAEIIIATKRDALLLPIEVIQKSGNKYFVMLKDENKEEPKLCNVKLGLVSEDYAEIVEGLKEGDSVMSLINTQTTKQNMPMGFGMGMPGQKRPGGQKNVKNR